MGPNATNSHRSRVYPSVYSNNTHSNLPATSFATERSRCRSTRRNHAAPQGIHLATQPLKVPSREAQPRHGVRHQPQYPYVPTDQQDHTTPQNSDRRDVPSSRKRQTRDRERPAPVKNTAPSHVSANLKHGVAMVFVPEQPAKRAIAFESSLFQRDDPSAAPPQPYQRMPLSELNDLPNIPLNQYPHATLIPPPPEHTPRQENTPRQSTRESSERSRAHPSRSRPLPPLSPTPSRLSTRPSERQERDIWVADKTSLSKPRNPSRAGVPTTRTTRNLMV